MSSAAALSRSGGPDVSFFVSHTSSGGAQELMLNLADGFESHGYSTHRLALYPSPNRLESPWSLMIERRPRLPLNQLKMIASLVRYFRTQRPAAAVTAMPAANFAVSLAVMLAGSKTRVIPTHHVPTDTYAPALRRLNEIAASFGCVRRVVSVSNAVDETVRVAGSRSLAVRRKCVIKNALPPDIERFIGELVERRQSRAPCRNLVVASGRLAPQKNYPLLVKAMVHMPDVTVRIVGSGAEEEALRTFSRELGVADRLELLGQRSRREALSLIAEGEVFVQPSLFEGHSLGLVEAAKMGLPLVVSEVPSQVEGITADDGGRCGIAVPPEDPSAFAEAVTGLLQSPSLIEHWSARARHLAATASYDSMVAQYIRASLG